MASNHLVGHALARFSTDNLSCMVVRFDNKALQQTVERVKDPIGVDGDLPSSKEGGISEADSIIKEARKSMPDAGQLIPKEKGELDEKANISQEVIREEEGKEPGPEVDPEGLEKAAKLQQGKIA